MKPIFILAFLLLTIALAAQNQCYRDLRKEGLSLLAKKDYRKAIDKLFAARYCPDKPAKDDLDALIKKTQDAWVKELNDTKKAALDSKAEAEQLRDQAELVLEKATQEKIRADAEREKAEAALKNLQLATAQIISLLIKEIDQHILKLEYEAALEKCEGALALDIKNQETIKRLQELAFFYNEIGQFAKVNSVLQLLDYKPKIQEHQILLKAIQDLNKNYYDTLQRRYYPEILSVESGIFMMGKDMVVDAKPGHQMVVNSFRISKTEITVWQYYIFAASTKKQLKSPSWGWLGDNPIVNVSFYNAIEYSNWLSKQFNLIPYYSLYIDNFNNTNIDIDLKSNGFRLPLETEWEFAARGGNLEKDRDYRYSGGNNLEELGWYNDNSINRSHSVGQKKPNELGIYDLTGNVWEWCWNGDNVELKAFNKSRYPFSSYKVIRGGAWSEHSINCRIISQDTYDFNFINSNIGFRIATN